jgi:hypothetical protein
MRMRQNDATRRPTRSRCLPLRLRRPSQDHPSRAEAKLRLAWMSDDNSPERRTGPTLRGTHCRVAHHLVPGSLKRADTTVTTDSGCTATAWKSKCRIQRLWSGSSGTTASRPRRQPDRSGDLVKIGVTVNLPTRINAFNVPGLELLGTEPGDQRLERQRHAEFKDLRVQGEWFTLTDRLKTHIAAVSQR